MGRGPWSLLFLATGAVGLDDAAGLVQLSRRTAARDVELDEVAAESGMHTSAQLMNRAVQQAMLSRAEVEATHLDSKTRRQLVKTFEQDIEDSRTVHELIADQKDDPELQDILQSLLARMRGDQKVVQPSKVASFLQTESADTADAEALEDAIKSVRRQEKTAMALQAEAFKLDVVQRNVLGRVVQLKKLIDAKGDLLKSSASDLPRARFEEVLDNPEEAAKREDEFSKAIQRAAAQAKSAVVDTFVRETMTPSRASLLQRGEDTMNRSQYIPKCEVHKDEEVKHYWRMNLEYGFSEDYPCNTGTAVRILWGFKHFSTDKMMYPLFGLVEPYDVRNIFKVIVMTKQSDGTWLDFGYQMDMNYDGVSDREGIIVNYAGLVNKDTSGSTCEKKQGAYLSAEWGPGKLFNHCEKTGTSNNFFAAWKPSNLWEAEEVYPMALEFGSHWGSSNADQVHLNIIGANHMEFPYQEGTSYKQFNFRLKQSYYPGNTPLGFEFVFFLMKPDAPTLEQERLTKDNDHGGSMYSALEHVVSKVPLYIKADNLPMDDSLESKWKRKANVEKKDLKDVGVDVTTINSFEGGLQSGTYVDPNTGEHKREVRILPTKAQLKFMTDFANHHKKRMQSLTTLVTDRAYISKAEETETFSKVRNTVFDALIQAGKTKMIGDNKDVIFGKDLEGWDDFKKKLDGGK